MSTNVKTSPALESKAFYQQAAQEITQASSEIGAGALSTRGHVAQPADADELHSSLGAAYAGLGDAPRAISEGKKGMEMRITSKDPFEGLFATSKWRKSTLYWQCRSGDSHP